jgi:hypothetical protein
VPLLDAYAAHLRSVIVDAVDHPAYRDKPLTGLKIAVDAGNGSGGFFADKARPRARGGRGGLGEVPEAREGFPAQPRPPRAGGAHPPAAH